MTFQFINFGLRLLLALFSLVCGESLAFSHRIGECSGSGPFSRASFPFRWVFASDCYQYDPDAMSFSSGQVALTLRDQLDDDGTATGFGGGVFARSQWDAANGWVELDGTSTPQPFDDNESTSGYQDMSTNILLIHLDDGAGATTFTDDSGNGNDLTCTATECPTNVGSGFINGAFDFDGSNDRADGDIADFSGSDYSVSLWAKPDVTGQSQFSSVFNNNDTGAGSFNTFQIDTNGSDQWRFFCSDNSRTFGAFTTNWTHIGITYNATTRVAIAYINGQEGNRWTLAANECDNWTDFNIGSNRAKTQFFDGQLDEMALFTKPLSAQDMAIIYAVQSSTITSGTFTSRIFDAGGTVAWDTFDWIPRRPYMKELPGSAAAESAYAEANIDMNGNTLLYHLNETSGTSFTDSSGSGNTGSCTNCPTLDIASNLDTAVPL